MFIPVRKRLGDILREENLISEEQLQIALTRQKETNERLGQALVSLGYVDQLTVLRILEAKLGIPFVNISRRMLDPDVVNLITEQLAQKYKVIPIEKNGDKIILAMADPLNVMAIDDVRITTGYDVEPSVAFENEIDDAIASYYAKGTIDKIVEDIRDDMNLELDEAMYQMRDMVEDAPIVKLVNSLINQAVTSRASDIHVEPRDKDVRVRYRIDGVLTEATSFNKKMQAPIISRFKIMANLDIAERRKPQDGRIQLRIDNKDVDLRVSTLPTIFGEKIVLRILDKTKGIIHLPEIGMHYDILNKFRQSIVHPYGIILVTGPTGSGKTTTMYAVLNDVNSPEKNIVTLEDPVEYTISGVNQVQLNTKAGLTFASGLRSILRQDPNIIMVGEIRDTETAKIAIEAAMTGHLVISTLHTNTAASTLARLVEMGVEPFLLASAVLSIVAQRLVRRLCPECKEPYEPSQALIDKLGLKPEPGQELVLFKNKGCPACGNTGFRGRLALQEVLFMSSEIRDLVTGKFNTDQIQATAVQQGMVTIREDAIRKIVLGLTSVEEAMRAIYTAEA